MGVIWPDLRNAVLVENPTLRRTESQSRIRLCPYGHGSPTLIQNRNGQGLSGIGMVASLDFFSGGLRGLETR